MVSRLRGRQGSQGPQGPSLEAGSKMHSRAHKRRLGGNGVGTEGREGGGGEKEDSSKMQPRASTAVHDSWLENPRRNCFPKLESWEVKS